MKDPLAGSAWSDCSTVEGFVRSAPNATLLAYAQRAAGQRRLRIADIGCGAGRNAVPLASAGADVIATDLSLPMAAAASARADHHRLLIALAPMDALPVRDRSIDMVVAHGIWNLARSDAEWHRAAGEASRIAAPHARLFVFTFSRHTLPPACEPVAGERFTFTQFSGAPQIFMTDEELITALARHGFHPDPDLPLREHNLPPPGQPRLGGPPVIYEGGFVFKGV